MEWNRHILMFVAIGFQVNVLGMAFHQWSYGDASVYALMISGYVAYLTAFILSILTTLGSLKENQLALIANTVILVVVVALLVAGIGLLGSRMSADGVISQLDPYATTVGVLSAFLALVGAVFSVLQVLGF